MGVIWTARLPHHGCPGYTGPDALDVTRGSGGPFGGAFAPSRELLAEANKRKRAAKGDADHLAMVWSWYVPLYTEEMRTSWRTNRQAWLAMLARDLTTLCCYCAHPERCHRSLLAVLLQRAGERRGIEVVVYGERGRTLL